jgi:hypothetical protein
MNEDKNIPYLLITFSMVFALIGWMTANGKSKTQYVRLFHVFLYGPYLTYLAFQTEYVFSLIEKLFLLFLGVTTISYNAKNYLHV